MPPKKQDKNVQKAKQKAAEDKTFGLKNKNKSSKVQKYIKEVQHQVSQPGRKADGLEGPSKKELEKAKKEELNDIFKPVQVQQKVPFGVDPKTILCQFFKAGTCTKGKSCKFSHDSTVERKGAKIDLYTDNRTTEKEDDTMDKWDQAKLEDVVHKKHGKGIQTTTDIVCKFFLQAVEDRKYGWFWQCPNGDSCKYRHALPPGFILKEHQRKKKEDEEVQTLEEWIEEQRSQLPAKLTPVTLETFMKWKQQRLLKQKKEEEERLKQVEQAIKAGRSIGASGRDLFTYNPDLFNMDDDEEAWEGDYTQREEEAMEDVQATTADSKPSVAIDESLFEAEDLEALGLTDDDLDM